MLVQPEENEPYKDWDYQYQLDNDEEEEKNERQRFEARLNHLKLLQTLVGDEYLTIEEDDYEGCECGSDCACHDAEVRGNHGSVGA